MKSIIQFLLKHLVSNNPTHRCPGRSASVPLPERINTRARSASDATNTSSVDAASKLTFEAAVSSVKEGAFYEILTWNEHRHADATAGKSNQPLDPIHKTVETSSINNLKAAESSQSIASLQK